MADKSEAESEHDLAGLAIETVDDNEHMMAGYLESNDYEERSAHLDALANTAMDSVDDPPSFGEMRRAIEAEVDGRVSNAQ